MRQVQQALWLLMVALLALSVSAQAQTQPPDLILYRDEDTLAIYVTGARHVNLENLALVITVGGNGAPQQRQPYYLTAYQSGFEPPFDASALQTVREATCFWLVRDDHDSTPPLNCQQSEQNGRMYLRTLNTADVFWHNARVNLSYRIDVMRGEDILALCDGEAANCEVVVPDAVPTPEPPPPPQNPPPLDLENLPEVYKVSAVEGTQVYTTPSADSAALLQLPIDFQLESAAVEGKWVQIDFAGSVGYVLLDTLRPLTAQEHFNSGYDHSENKEYTEAVEDYTRAITINPDDGYAYNNRGAARVNQGDLDGAIADYDRAIELNPDYVLAYNNRGNARRIQGDLDRAIEDYTRAIELNPDDATAYNNRGIARRNQGDLDGAIEDYTRAIAINPDFAEAYHNRGTARSDLGNLEGALEDYSYAVRINPTYTNSYWGLGNVHYDRELFEDALKHYRRYIELAGESSAPDWMLERIRELEAQLTATPPG